MSTSCALQSSEPSSQTEKNLIKAKKRSELFSSGTLSSTSKGLFLALTSGLLYSITQAIVKHLKSIHPAQLAAYRYWATAWFNLPHLILSHENPLGHRSDRLSILILTISGAGGNFLIFVASRYLPVGEATALVCCHPAFITIVGRVFLKESLGIVQVIAVVATIIGAVLISGVYQTVAQNSRIYTNENLYGLAAATGSVIFMTIQLILMRKLASRNVHHSVIIFSSGVVGVILSTVLTALLGNFNFQCDGLGKGLIILLGILSYLTLVALTVSTRYAESGPVSTIRASSDIFSSFVWQVAIFSDIPDATTVFGAVLVCASVALIGFNQKINAFLPDKFKNLC